MKVIDSIEMSNEHGPALIEICHGDLTEMGPGADVDVLVVSAFPDEYSPIPNTLIGALHQRGISVYEMAQDKAADLRAWCSCWMSQDIAALPPGLSFRRIFCFEPRRRGDPSAVVDDLFRGLAPFLNDSQPSYVVAMPLLATGEQAVPIPAMLGAVVRSARRWIEFGLPIRRFQIVERSNTKIGWMADEFALIKKSIAEDVRTGTQPVKKALRTMRHMVSYAPEDAQLRDELVKSLQTLRRQGTIEVWHEGLVLPGTAVEAEVERHLDEDDVVLLLMSSDFLASDRCLDQAERALARHRRHEVRLIPVLAPPYRWQARHRVADSRPGMDKCRRRYQAPGCQLNVNGDHQNKSFVIRGRERDPRPPNPDRDRDRDRDRRRADGRLRDPRSAIGAREIGPGERPVDSVAGSHGERTPTSPPLSWLSGRWICGETTGTVRSAAGSPGRSVGGETLIVPERPHADGLRAACSRILRTAAK
jgi:hypothetical protein